MDPDIINNTKMYLVGIIEAAENIESINIEKMWNKFDNLKEKIKHSIPGIRYEIHVEDKKSKPLRHYCLIGVEVEKIVDIPPQMFIKEIPEGKYAVFTHKFKEGGFKKAFQNVYDWLKNSKYKSAYPFDIQSYDASFKGVNNPESEIEILLPIKEE